MLSLILDTETTGVPLKGVAPSDSRQARVMQLGAVLLDDDKEVACFYSRLFPDQWPTVHPAATAAHGLTVEMCTKTGVGQKYAFGVLTEMALAADVVVAHNWAFDYQMLTIEYELLGELFAPKKHACSMQLLTPVCGLTKSNGTPKWPSLAEAYAYCTGKSIDKAHDALADVRATADVWRWLIKNKKYEGIKN